MSPTGRRVPQTYVTPSITQVGAHCPSSGSRDGPVSGGEAREGPPAAHQEQLQEERPDREIDR